MHRYSTTDNNLCEQNSTFIDVTNPELEKSKKKLRTSDYFTEYCDNTTIHGLKYIGDQRRTIIEKICWILIFILSLYFCVDLIIKTHVKWKQSPIIIGFAQNPIPVWKVPFPAVTICPVTKSRRTLFNFAYTSHKYRNNQINMTQKEINNFHDMCLFCNCLSLKDPNTILVQDNLDFIEQISPSLNYSHIYSHWRTFGNEAFAHFVPLFTEEGVCYSFNILNRDDLFTDIVEQHKDFLAHNKSANKWSYDEGYTKDSNLNSYPFRDMYLSRKSHPPSLQLFLAMNTVDLDFLCVDSEQGFRVFLHHPAELPRIGSEFLLATLNQELSITIKTEMMTTSNELNDYPPDVRNCYFSNEKRLAFYKVYTQNNCEMECLANFTLARCGCVAFYMPHIKNTPLCGAGRIKCMESARAINVAYTEAFNFKEDFVENLLDDTVMLNNKSAYSQNNPNKINTSHDKDLKQCNCRPSCTSVNYDYVQSLTTFDWKPLVDVYNQSRTAFEGLHLSSIVIYYKNNKIIASERQELFGLIDLIANSGGILGLFTGFSFVSAFEILYYLTVRLWCNLRQSKQDKQKTNVK